MDLNSILIGKESIQFTDNNGMKLMHLFGENNFQELENEDLVVKK